MLKVCKFGGTSLASARTFKLVKDIILSDINRKIIVVSAPGKRYQEDIKVTDLLIELSQNPKSDRLIKAIKERFYNIIDGLNLDFDLEKEFIFNDNSCSYIISRGEYITAKIMAKYLGFDFCDAKDLIIFKKNGKVDIYKSKKRALKKNFKNGIVIPGFYGSRKGEIVLFPRGGSDVSGSYISRLYKADIYENFSDVSGISPVNPEIVSKPYFLDTITFKDFSSLDVLNPKVLEKSAYKPVIGTKTKIIIKNTFRPYDKGTTIINKKKFKYAVVFSVANDGDILVITGRNLTKKSGVYQIIQTAFNGSIDYKILKSSKSRIVLKLFSARGERGVAILYHALIPLIDRP